MSRWEPQIDNSVHQHLHRYLEVGQRPFGRFWMMHIHCFMLGNRVYRALCPLTHPRRTNHA